MDNSLWTKMTANLPVPTKEQIAAAEASKAKSAPEVSKKDLKDSGLTDKDIQKRPSKLFFCTEI